MPSRLLASSWRAPALALLVLALLAWGGWRGLTRLIASARDYQPVSAALALKAVPLPRSPVGEGNAALVSPPAAQQAVLVVVSGLRPDAPRRLPALADLARRGASADAIGVSSGASRAAWAALLTGAGPEMSGVGLVETSASSQPLAADTLLNSARRVGLNVGVFGRGPWESLVPAEFLRGGVTPSGYTVAAVADQSAVQAARDALRAAQVDLAVVSLSHPALAAAAYGSGSVEYERAVQAVDSLLGQLARDLDLKRSVVVITGDRAPVDTPTAGAELPTVPVILVGAGVKPGDYGRIAQTDLAPTLAALLGAAPPAHAQGVTRGDWLQVAPAARAQRGLADAAQKLGLEAALTDAYGTDRERLTVADEIGGLPVVATTLDLGNDAGGWKLAEATAWESARRMAALRLRALADAADSRLPTTLAVLGALVLAFAWRVNLRRALLTLAALVGGLVPLALFTEAMSLAGAPALVRPALLFLLTAAALAMAAALIWLWRRREPRAGRLTVAAGLGLLALVLGGVLTPAPVGPLDASLMDLARAAVGPTLVALLWGGAVCLALAWWDEERLAVPDVVWLLSVYSLALAGWLVAAAALLYWQVGATLQGFLPNLRLAAWQATTLARLLTVGLAGLLAPWLVAAAYLAGTLRLSDLPSPSHDIASERR